MKPTIPSEHWAMTTGTCRVVAGSPPRDVCGADGAQRPRSVRTPSWFGRDNYETNPNRKICIHLSVNCLDEKKTWPGQKQTHVQAVEGILPGVTGWRGVKPSQTWSNQIKPFFHPDQPFRPICAEGNAAVRRPAPQLSGDGWLVA